MKPPTVTAILASSVTGAWRPQLRCGHESRLRLSEDSRAFCGGAAYLAAEAAKRSGASLAVVLLVSAAIGGVVYIGLMYALLGGFVKPPTVTAILASSVTGAWRPQLRCGHESRLRLSEDSRAF